MIIVRWLLTTDFDRYDSDDATTSEMLQYVPLEIVDSLDDAKTLVSLEAAKSLDLAGRTSALDWRQMPEDGHLDQDGELWFLMRRGEDPVEREPVAVMLIERFVLRRETQRLAIARRLDEVETGRAP